MPNWKKVVTSGSNAELNALKLSGAVNAGVDTDKFLVLDATGNVDFRTGAEVLSDIGGQGTGNFVTDAGGFATELAVWSSTSAISGSQGLKWTTSSTPRLDAYGNAFFYGNSGSANPSSVSIQATGTGALGSAALLELRNNSIQESAYVRYGANNTKALELINAYGQGTTGTGFTSRFIITGSVIAGSDTTAQYQFSGSRARIELGNTVPLHTTGSIVNFTGTDTFINGWGSVSASLASINTSGTSQTLQQVTDNGNTTTNALNVTRTGATDAISTFKNINGLSQLRIISSGSSGTFPGVASIRFESYADPAQGKNGNLIYDGKVNQDFIYLINAGGAYAGVTGSTADSRLLIGGASGSLYIGLDNTDPVITRDGSADALFFGTASYALTASYTPGIAPLQSSIDSLNTATGSFVSSHGGAATQLAVWDTNSSISGSNGLLWVGSELQVNGTIAADSITGSLQGDVDGNASTATALTAGNKTITGNLTVTGKVTAEEFHTEFVSSSIIYQSGSTKFGDTADDRHQFTGSLAVQGPIAASSFTGSIVVPTGTLTIGSQIFYPQGNDGFSVNENFNVGNSTQTAYHYTSGNSARPSVVFSLARTGNFTNMFGVTGSAADNKFVFGAEFGNTDFEWRRNLGVTPVKLQGGTLLARLNRSGSLYVSNSITGSDLQINGFSSVSASLASLQASAPTLQNVLTNGNDTTLAIESTNYIVAQQQNLWGTNTNYLHTTFTSGSTIADSTSQQRLFTFSTTVYESVHIEYVVFDSGRNNKRTGTAMATWGAGQIQYTEVSTLDIGDTSNFSIEFIDNSGNVDLVVSNSTGQTMDFRYYAKGLYIT